MSKKPNDGPPPGWSLIERFMPHDQLEDQQEAYENVRELVKILVEIDMRLAREEAEKKRLLQPPLF